MNNKTKKEKRQEEKHRKTKQELVEKNRDETTRKVK